MLLRLLTLVVSVLHLSVTFAHAVQIGRACRNILGVLFRLHEIINEGMVNILHDTLELHRHFVYQRRRFSLLLFRLGFPKARRRNLPDLSARLRRRQSSLVVVDTSPLICHSRR